MPGILPMKVIKVGTSAQSRIAQACDRCRSKKIRCDGIRPCCSQCANVGFECKTSDKLSRRAFPRGYTESLEERVRTLESEVRELKDLLDEKDEKIDMLSRIQSGSRHPSMSRSPASSSERKPSIGDMKQDTFRVQQSAILLEGENTDCYFMGGSSGRSFVDAFKRKIQDHGKSGSAFNTEDFFAANNVTANSRATPDPDSMSTAPPRLVSDQMINIFLQEWSPLFPVLHRPTFLKLYEDYVACPEGVNDSHAIAQLNLVFGIAALSAEWNKQDVASFEAQWQPALESIQSENTFDTLQCLVLAQIYCISNADYSKLIHYKRIAVGLLHHLGLHQSQKNCSQGALTGETRKKVFWSQYTLDAFSAALLGLPKLLKEDDIQVEFPSDVDDENVTESGFQSIPPGESTRLSSALALFRAAQILSKVLDEVYPPTSSHELSLQQLCALNQDLDDWLKDLAPHLRLQFVQDKPSTGTVSSRSPLLSLAYYYIRTLIHRPAIGSSLGSKASSSVMTLADSSKHIIQIIQLLEERRMSFTFCLNRNELLLLSGFGLLYQSIDLDRDGKLIRDSQRLISSATAICERDSAPGAAEFQKIALSLMPIDGLSKPNSAPTTSSTAVPRRKSDSNMPAPQATQRSTRKQLQAIASRFSFGASTHHRPQKHEDHNGRRVTLPTLIPEKAPHAARNSSQRSISSARSEPIPHRADFHSTSTTRPQQARLVPAYECPNLDYFPLGHHDSTPTPSFPPTAKPAAPLADWEHIFNCTLDTLGTCPIADLHAATTPSWIDGWGGAPTPDEHGGLISGGGGMLGPSSLSLSEESLTSGSCEDLSSVDFGAGGGQAEYRGIMMPSGDGDAYGELGGLDGNFGL